MGNQLALPEEDPIRNDLERKYREWLCEHANVYALFERFAMQMLQARRRFGVKMLAERVRWEVRTTWTDDADGYKFNNNYTAYVARDLIAKYPTMADLIETRKIRDEEEDSWKTPL